MCTRTNMHEVSTTKQKKAKKRSCTLDACWNVQGASAGVLTARDRSQSVVRRGRLGDHLWRQLYGGGQAQSRERWFTLRTGLQLTISFRGTPAC